MVNCQYVVQQISNRLKFPILTKKNHASSFPHASVKIRVFLCFAPRIGKLCQIMYIKLLNDQPKTQFEQRQICFSLYYYCRKEPFSLRTGAMNKDKYSFHIGWLVDYMTIYCIILAAPFFCMIACFNNYYVVF